MTVTQNEDYFNQGFIKVWFDGTQVDVGVTPIEKKDKEMVKVCTMKATGSTNEEGSC